MSLSLEYHHAVRSAVKRPARYSTRLAFTIFAVVLTAVFPSSNSFAQNNNSSFSGSAHSGSSAPFAGSVAPPTGSIAPPTGAASVHAGSVTFNSGLSHSSSFPHSPGNLHDFGGHRPHSSTSDGNFAYPYYPYVYAVPVPYAADAGGDSDDDDSDYQGGPTIFDRRGSGRDSYIPPSYPGPAHAQDQQSADSLSGDESARGADSAPQAPQVPTTLVFKDGHQLEVDNYAIVSQTLYDLTPGHARKIALADLDLSATQRQNDDHGIDFQLPPSSLTN